MNNINKTHRIDSIIPCLQILNDAKQINLIRLIKRIALVNVDQRKQTVAEVCVGGGDGGYHSQSMLDKQVNANDH